MKYYSAIVVSLSVALGLAPALAHDIAADDRGWYRRGLHNPTNMNYLTGDAVSGDPTYSFFVFNLDGVSEEIVGASLRLRLEDNGLVSDQGFETLALNEVTTDIDALIGGTGGMAGFEDLADGPQFGGVTASGRDRDATITVPLNAAGLAALNASRGERIAIGASLVSADNEERIEFLFGFSGSVSSDTRLILETADASVGGSVAGGNALVAFCENLSDPQSVVIPLAENMAVEAFDCEAAGLNVTPGDQLRILVRANVPGNEGNRLNGTVTGLSVTDPVVCANDTRDEVSGWVVTGIIWDCVRSGIPLIGNDSVRLVITGTAN
ncbi:MAG: hypothetical protein AAGA68_13170 [Pseudomonadota bacterium]